MTDLGTLGGGNSEAHGINDSGQVVGFAYTGSHYSRAFLYEGGVMKDLGALGGRNSQANGINNNGQIVGSAYLTGDLTQHAFLYSGGSMVDLNTLISASAGWNVDFAEGINDNGQIVGSGSDPLGRRHALLLTPIPEPDALALLLSGCAVLLLRRRG